jgi:L-asparagine transporter-like permease
MPQQVFRIRKHSFRVKPADEAVVGLRRTLGTFDLTMLGIAAIIGAGIFAWSVRRAITADRA